MTIPLHLLHINKFKGISKMKFKSLFALALTLATIGLSLPAVAGDRDNHNNRRNERHERQDDRHNSHQNRRHNYYGKYHYYQLSDGSHIYIGSKGDYWDQDHQYHPDSDSNDYEKYYSDGYDYKKGNYYYEGKYYSKR
jgi:hypothetical protein